MVVEDHADTREVFDVMLALRGFEVSAVETADLAFAELRREPRPCVVLLDVHLPDVDGWDFLNRLRREPGCNDVPVIIVSGDLAQQKPARARGFEFLAKPVEPDELVAAVERHCRRHRDPSHDGGVRDG